MNHLGSVSRLKLASWLQGRPGGRLQMVSQGRLAECLELLRAEQERSKRLLALMNAHEQAAAERSEQLRMQACPCASNAVLCLLCPEACWRWEST